MNISPVLAGSGWWLYNTEPCYPALVFFLLITFYEIIEAEASGSQAAAPTLLERGWSQG